MNPKAGMKLSFILAELDEFDGDVVCRLHEQLNEILGRNKEKPIADIDMEEV